METLAIRAAYEQALGDYRAGRRAEAEGAFHRIIEQQPDHADALQMLGILAHQAGRNAEAADWLRKAIASNPNVGSYHSNLGLALMALDHVDEALMVCRRAVEIRPDQPDAQNNLGHALMSKGAINEAIEHYRQAIALRPAFPEALNNLGIALGEKKQLTQAIDTFRAALALRPHYAQALSNLGNALMFIGKLDASIAAYHQAIGIHPTYAEAYNNLGGVLQQAGQIEPAMAAFRKAIELRRGYAEAIFGLALLQLLVGEYARGFASFEARAAMKTPVVMGNLPTPLWDGSPLEGRRILLHREQGLGDTIFYVRYAALVKARGGRTLLRVQPGLNRLLIDQPGIDEVSHEEEALPDHDVHCPLAGLPLRLGTTMQTIPNRIPYLRADPNLAGMWHRRLSELPRRINIGLVWAGNAQFMHDLSRSMPLAALSSLAGIEGARFFSLQKGPAAEQLRQCPAGMNLVDWTGELRDFADTAALIANLDAVVSVDTAVAHLAGALARPVGLLVPFAPDWRWMLGRADSPWYPSFRLFRQRRPFDWTDPIFEMSEALRGIVKQRGP